MEKIIIKQMIQNGHLEEAYIYSEQCRIAKGINKSDWLQYLQLDLP